MQMWKIDLYLKFHLQETTRLYLYIFPNHALVPGIRCFFMCYLLMLIVELTSLATRNFRDICWFILITAAETLNQHEE